MGNRHAQLTSRASLTGGLAYSVALPPDLTLRLTPRVIGHRLLQARWSPHASRHRAHATSIGRLIVIAWSFRIVSM